MVKELSPSASECSTDICIYPNTEDAGAIDMPYRHV